MKERDWTPVLSAHGLIYCSPACGSECTKASYDLAFSRAKALAERLGEGWVPRLWENGGWHYKVTKGSITIHVSYFRDEPPTYSAWIEPGIFFGHSVFQIIEKANDPEDALGIAKQKAWEAISRIREAIVGLEGEL